MVERCDYYSDEEFTAALIAEREQYELEKESRDFEAYCAERQAIQEENVKRLHNLIRKDSEKEDGIVVDSDTVLADIMNEVSFEETGLAKEIFDIYIRSSDRDSVANLFYAFTGVTLEEYIEKCENT